MKDSFLELVDNAFGKQDIQTTSDLLSILSSQQNIGAKPLFILDQVEEAYTRPLSHQTGIAEVQDFLQFLQPILTNKEASLTLMLNHLQIPRNRYPT